MKETIVNWPNGGMGNTVYCLLFLCSEELNKGWKLPTNELNFHHLASELYNDRITRIHGPHVTLIPSDSTVVCSHDDFLLIQLLRLYKWYEKLPSFDNLVYFETNAESNQDKLERLVLWLKSYPTFEYNFDIFDFFVSDAVTRLEQFILSRELTPNNRVHEFVDCVVQMNKPYIDEWNFLKETLVDALNGTDKQIYLHLHQQAFIMTWMMQKGFKFKLMPLVTNTNQFLQYLEI